MFNVFNRSLIALAAFLFLLPHAEARTRHHGKCDGFHACRCGVTAARHAGLPLLYNGWNLKRAVEWLHFPRTRISAGAVGYVRRGGPSGHVFTVLSYSGGDTARVYDDRGTYERPIRGAVFVDPNGNAAHRQAQTYTPTIY